MSEKHDAMDVMKSNHRSQNFYTTFTMLTFRFFQFSCWIIPAKYPIKKLKSLKTKFNFNPFQFQRL